MMFVTVTNDILVPAFEYPDLLASKNTVSSWDYTNIILKQVVKKMTENHTMRIMKLNDSFY
jgi:hypothetical protein